MAGLTGEPASTKETTDVKDISWNDHREHHHHTALRRAFRCRPSSVKHPNALRRPDQSARYTHDHPAFGNNQYSSRNPVHVANKTRVGDKTSH